MQIITQGYTLKFIQTHPSCAYHEKRFVYKFFSKVTKLHYIVLADSHKYNFYAIKFYAKKDRGSFYKYSKVINRGDVANVLVSCAKIIPRILEFNAKASFGFIGSRGIDLESNKIEDYKENQRFRLYSYHIPQLIGDRRFLHKSYKNASCYALFNKNISNLENLERNIKNEIFETYPDLLNVQF